MLGIPQSIHGTDRSRRIDKMILHCSDTDYEKQRAEWIDRIHRKKGLGGIAYHFFIQKNGLIEVGKPINAVGFHCEGVNAHSLGICCAGQVEFTNETMYSLKVVLLPLLRRIFPSTTLHGHKEFAPHKTCPIFNYTDLRIWWNHGE